MKRLIPLLLLISAWVMLLPGSGVVAAAPLDKTDVPANVKWMAHLDIEGLLQSELGKFILQQVDSPRLRARIDKFTNTFGFNPLTDLRSATIFGTQFEPGGAVAIIRARFQQEKLLELLRKHEGHEQLLEGERIVHRWSEKPDDDDDDGVRYGTIFNRTTIIVSRSKAALLEAIAVLEGKADDLASHDSGILPQLPQGTFFAAGLLELQLPEDAHPQLAALKSGIIILGESNETAFGSVEAIMHQEVDGHRYRHLLQGMLSLTFMRLERRPQKPGIEPIKQLLNRLIITGQGPRVEIHFDAPVESVKNLLINVAEQARLKMLRKQSAPAKN